MLERIWQDLRYTARGLRRNSGFTAAVVVTLALGIGANATMYGIVDRMLFRPPPMLRDPSTAHRLYYYSTSRGRERAFESVQYRRYIDLSTATHSFSQFAAYSSPDLVVGVGDAAREMPIGVVSASFFNFFDAPPALGRYFDETEDRVPAGLAVISHALWSTRFGERPEALGARIQIDTTIYTVVGVAPPGFVGLWPDQPPAAYIPITAYAANRSASLGKGNWWRTYRSSWISVIARRRSNTSIVAANAELTDAARRSYAAEMASQPRGRPASIALVRPRAIAASIVAERGPNESTLAKLAMWMTAVSGIVLLIACANVASLLLARAVRRRREIAVRLALGVSRPRLVSQLLTESLVLAVLGGAAGILVAQWGGAAFRAAFLSASSPATVFGDTRTLTYTAGIAVVMGLLTGLTPLLQAFRTSATLADDLKAGAAGSGHGRSRLRSGLLITQTTLTFVLLVGAGLFVRSLLNVWSVPLGYDVDPILWVELNSRGTVLDDARANALRNRLLDVAKAQPGVVSASRATGLPLRTTWSFPLFVQGIDSVSRVGQFNVNAVSPGFLATFGMRLMRGRGFNDADSPTAPRVMIVSQGMARALWPGREALGQCMRIEVDTLPCRSVVGIVQDVHQLKLRPESRMYSYYLPAAQFDARGSLVLRMASDGRRQVESIRRALQREMPGASYVTVTSFSDIVGSKTKSWRLGATMFVGFGALALLLAGVGLYSVIAHIVAQRTRELGVRIALGAQARDVVQRIVAQGVAFAGLGLAIGVVVALGAAHWIAPLLFSESPHDPVVLLSAAVVLLTVSATASWIPARRAANADPLSALRSE